MTNLLVLNEELVNEINTKEDHSVKTMTVLFNSSFLKASFASLLTNVENLVESFTGFTRILETQIVPRLKEVVGSSLNSTPVKNGSSSDFTSTPNHLSTIHTPAIPKDPVKAIL